MNFEIRKAYPEEYREIAHVIEHTLETISNQAWFVADNAEYTYRTLTENKGVGYVAVDTASNQLAAVFMTLLPACDDPQNLGLDAGLCKEALSQVAHMESVSVLPAYRGHKLQRKLMAQAEADLQKEGIYHYLFCTIHPDNKYSMNNALSLGYKQIKVCEKYGGYLRAVLMKELP